MDCHADLKVPDTQGPKISEMIDLSGFETMQKRELVILV